MNIAEFSAVIKEGFIEVPQRFRDRFVKTVRVILLDEQEAADEDIISRLLQHPFKIAEFRPLTRDEIYGKE